MSSSPPVTAACGFAKLLVEHVAKQYPTRGEPLVVLRDVSLELKRGENVAVLGPSGSGKSTLLSIIGALEPPSSGRIVLDGQDPATLAEPELAAFRNRQIGFVFQDHHLLPQCSVLENVLVPTVAAGRTPPETVERARMLLDRVGLGDRLEHRPAELSGGERQRVALARALINAPLLLLADEPTGNLDRTTAARVGQLLLELQQQEQTMLIVVTHSPRLAGMMGRQLELDEGLLEGGVRNCPMSAIRLILSSLWFHWRTNLAVACGVAVGTAVLTGALLVGDSMRGSLRHLTLDRLGRIDEASGDRPLLPGRAGRRIGRRCRRFCSARAWKTPIRSRPLGPTGSN